MGIVKHSEWLLTRGVFQPGGGAKYSRFFVRPGLINVSCGFIVVYYITSDTGSIWQF